MNSSSPVTIVSIGILTLFILAAWVLSYTDESYTLKLAELSSNEKKWKQFQLSSFSYVSESGCMFVQRYRIENRDGKNFEFPIEQSPSEQSLKIENVFEQAEKAIRQAYRVEVKYHQYFGFPELIDIDWDKNTIDDECFIQIKSFKVSDENES